MRFAKYILSAGVILHASSLIGLQAAHAQSQDDATQRALEFLKGTSVQPLNSSVELSDPKPSNSKISTPEISTPEISTPKSFSPELSAPSAIKPKAVKPARAKPALTNPTFAKPVISEIGFAQENYTDLTLPVTTPQARLQKGQRVSDLKTLAGLEMKRFARRIGEISSISRGAEGQLYITDSQSGRLYILPDRDQNGRPEQVRPLPHRFNGPTASIELGDYLYVADREAIWKLPKSRISQQTPILLANLKNTNSHGRYFLVSQQAATSHLTLGYTTQTGKARLISIDTQTGRAALQDETEGVLLQLSATSGPKPWRAYSHQNELYIGTDFDSAAIGTSLAVNGMVLPDRSTTPSEWPKSLDDHVFISRANPINVTALQTSLGTVLPRGRTIFSGFQNGRTAWGRAGALHMDKRGLFIADPYNGDLWLIKPETKVKKTAGEDRIQAAIDKFRAASEQDQNPLKRDPLATVQDTFFPDPNDPQEPAISPTFDVESPHSVPQALSPQNEAPRKNP